MNPHIRMKKNGDRVMAILFLELLLTGGTLLHTDADVRMMSREVLMCPSISFMQLTPLPHKTNEIKVHCLDVDLGRVLGMTHQGQQVSRYKGKCEIQKRVADTPGGRGSLGINGVDMRGGRHQWCLGGGSQ
jgi:hypothetical protein